MCRLVPTDNELNSKCEVKKSGPRLFGACVLRENVKRGGGGEKKKKKPFPEVIIVIMIFRFGLSAGATAVVNQTDAGSLAGPRGYGALIK